MPKWAFGKSIKTQFTTLLFILTAISILIVGFLGIRGILVSGSQAESITTSSAKSRAEQFLVQTTLATASKNSLVFNNIQNKTTSVAVYTQNIFNKSGGFTNTWRFDEHVFRHSKGQWWNSNADLANVLIGNYTTPDAALKQRIELLHNLDYLAPQVLKSEPNAVALYFIGDRGESFYYPYIDLGSIIPPDLNPNTLEFYTVAKPSKDPKRAVKWTSVYDDPVGNGLLITASHPVYTKAEGFIGVISLDVTLNNIAKNIEDYSPIETSYAFLINNTGRAVAFPKQAYQDVLGRDAKNGEFGPDLSKVTGDFATVLGAMRDGKDGFTRIDANNKSLYIAYAPVKGTTFSLGIAASESALLSVANDLRNQVNQTTNSVLYFQILPAAIAILALIWLAGFLYIRVLTRPLADLTAQTRKIMQGDFTSSSVMVKGSNEIGNLAAAFNKMATELARSYQVLQRQVHELAAGKAKDDAMLTSIGDGVIVTDQTGKILLINSVGAELLGVSSTEILNKSYMSFTVYSEKNEPIPEAERPLTITLHQSKKVTKGARIMDARGVKRELSLTSSPVLEAGKLIGGIEIIRDVTREHEVDRVKTDFISIASHQLRTPLSAIRWFSEMLSAGDAGKLKPEQQEFVDNITQSTRRMIELVGSLLSISRLESGRVAVNPHPTDIKELIEKVVSELKTEITDRHQQIVVEVDPGLPKMNIDPRLVGQVYMNLLTNAIKYTPNSGRVTVRVMATGDDMVSEIKDNGYGIPKEEQSKIFDRFFRATNVIKVETDGTGLGLYLIKTIVESAGGRVWFESAEGQGTTFWFTLPLKGMQAKGGDIELEA